MDLRARVAELMPQAREELAELVAIRSVADPRQFPPEECDGPPSGCSTSSRRSASPTPGWSGPPDGSRPWSGSQTVPDPEAPDGPALRPLRRAAAAGRRRLADAAVRAHRGRRPLVRPRRRRLQGQHRHAPRRAARPGRRRPGQPQAGRRGVRGAGHRRARGLRRRARPTCSAPTRSWSATPATRRWASRRPPSACAAWSTSS